MTLYIWSPEEEGSWSPGGATRWWLHQSLTSLATSLRRHKGDLILREGAAAEVLSEVLKESGADTVYWSRRYEPAAITRDKQLKSEFKEKGVDVRSFNSSLLIEPWEVATQSGDPYKVFTPFWKSATEKIETSRQVFGEEPTGLSLFDRTEIHSLDLEELGLMPKIRWYEEMQEFWTPGEEGAEERLEEFLQSHVSSYDVDRDYPFKPGVSFLYPHLHFGEISLGRIFSRTREVASKSSSSKMKNGARTFLKELGWREFAHHVLFHFPETNANPLREKFNEFPWSDSDEALRAWQKGNTGFPIVDAGMRELWATGWMHNRVRMIVASFLTKDLMITWLEGAKWFWDTLVDADLANNTLGWQWASGCGADAAPYFRIFNPVLQGKKFDPDGTYVKRWVPELKSMPDKYIHCPWEAPPSVLDACGVVLGKDYPAPIVDHSTARKRALAAFEKVK